MRLLSTQSQALKEETEDTSFFKKKPSNMSEKRWDALKNEIVTRRAAR